MSTWLPFDLEESVWGTGHLFFFPSASQHNEIFHMGTQTVSKRAICASERNKYWRKQVKSLGTSGSVRPQDVRSCLQNAGQCWDSKRVLQTISIVTSLFGSGLQDTCFMLMPTPWIHCKWWHSGRANQLSIQCSVCISYLQYHVCSTPVNIWSKSCRSSTNTGRFQFHIKVTLTVVLLYRAS